MASWGERAHDVGGVALAEHFSGTNMEGYKDLLNHSPGPAKAPNHSLRNMIGLLSVTTPENGRLQISYQPIIEPRISVD